MTPPVAELFRLYGGTVFRRCRQMLGDDATAHDAVQEVFLRVLGKGQSFRGESSTLTWIYRVATTYCLQQLRNAKRRQAKLEALALERSVQSTVIERLTVQAVLEETDPQVQEILYLRFVDGMTLEEVVEVVHLSRKTVQLRIDAFTAKARATLHA